MDELAVRVIAEQTARKKIKEQLRQRRVKLSYVSAKEIISQARAWLLTHPEIIAEARAKAQSWAMLEPGRDQWKNLISKERFAL